MPVTSIVSEAKLLPLQPHSQLCSRPPTPGVPCWETSHYLKKHHQGYVYTSKLRRAEDSFWLLPDNFTTLTRPLKSAATAQELAQHRHHSQ